MGLPTGTTAASLLFASLAFAAGSLVEVRADACTPPRHSETIVAPRTGESLPASAPGIVVRGEEGIDLRLFDAADEPVAGGLAKAGYRTYFAPTAPLAPGSYTLRYSSHGPDDADPPLTLESVFTVTPSRALPTSTGMLTVVATDRATRSVMTSSGSCVEEADVAMVRLALEPDAGLAPYAAVVAWETKVDGHHWQQGLGTLAGSDGVRTVLNLFTACDGGGSQFRDNGVKAGAHDVELTPIVVGSAATIAPAKLRVTVSCGPDNGAVHPATVDDDAAVDEGAGVGDGERIGTAAPAAEPPASRAADASDSGCSTAPGDRRPSMLASLAAVALALAVTRRRRSR
ncbi:MAG: hypothetical protein KF850_32875 [Labilithrix sp.]|nr:hypothetical protein [Labilithrix sp.]